jgi:hypothetical protein
MAAFASSLAVAAGGSPTIQQLSFADYDVIYPHLQEGGWGKVYSASLKADPNETIAMKFFGYTKQQPITSEIMKEINLMKNLIGVEGVVQLVGVFSDTAQGCSKPSPSAPLSLSNHSAL